MPFTHLTGAQPVSGETIGSQTQTPTRIITLPAWNAQKGKCLETRHMCLEFQSHPLPKVITGTHETETAFLAWQSRTFYSSLAPSVISRNRNHPPTTLYIWRRTLHRETIEDPLADWESEGFCPTSQRTVENPFEAYRREDESSLTTGNGSHGPAGFRCGRLRTTGLPRPTAGHNQTC